MTPKVTFKVSTTSNTSLPFLYRFIKKEEHEKEMLDTFRKVEINKPIFDAIKQVRKYEFFKDYASTRESCKGMLL